MQTTVGRQGTEPGYLFSMAARTRAMKGTALQTLTLQISIAVPPAPQRSGRNVGDQHDKRQNSMHVGLAPTRNLTSNAVGHEQVQVWASKAGPEVNHPAGGTQANRA
jgi:hypothetical protein